MGRTSVAVGAVAVLAVSALTSTSPASAAIHTADADAARHYGRSLFATDGVAADDVWAVGLTPGDRAAIRHWDGKQWASARHPASANSSAFVGVDARTADDAWAVGSDDPDGTGVRVAYAQHWDGSGWRTVAADPDLFTSEAKAVDAFGADDAWIVGDAQTSAAGSLIALAEHWDGTHWVSVPTAKVDPGCDAVLSDVAVIAADDVWAAGTLSCDGSTALLEHWDGDRWTRIHVPRIWRHMSSGLSGLAAVAPDDVWAVGFATHQHSTAQNMTLHWDGSRWSVVPSPNPGDVSCDHSLAAVSGSSSGDVWAAGSRSCSDGVTPEMLHWDGTAWSASAIPPSGFDDPPGDGLFDVVAISKTSAVTVGIAKTRGPSVEAGFIEHWNGRHWSLD